jgi:putative membrane protein
MIQHALRKTIACAALVSLAAALPAFSQGFGPYPKPKEVKPAATVAKEDIAFMEKAMSGSVLEVELGKTAQSRGTHPKVKEFGARMAKDHTFAGEELRRLGTSKGIALTFNADDNQRKDLEHFRKKVEPKAFDREYVEYMVKDHKEDIGEFERAAASAKDPDVKAYAAKTLPTLREHLKLAQDAEAALKGAKK